MLSADKLKQLVLERQTDVEQLARHLVRAGRDRNKAVASVKNWQKGLFKPQPSAEDIRQLAAALSVDVNDLMDWRSSYRYAPVSARKARLVAQLIAGRSVQDAMDILKFTKKRAAGMMDRRR
jgi:large subunit ribosomal protein L22